MIEVLYSYIKGLSNEIFHYARCIMPKRVTNIRGPSPRHWACGQHSSFQRSVAAVVSRWQYCVRFDWP